jgi:hypothetical protein
VRRMAEKKLDKDRINTESESAETAEDKGVTSTDLLCQKLENIVDGLIIGFPIKHKSGEFGFVVRIDKEDQSWEKAFNLIGTNGHIPLLLMHTLKDQKIIPGIPFDFR